MTQVNAMKTIPDAIQPTHRDLFGPGPSNPAPSVLKAMALPTIGHLDPAFIQVMDEIKAMLQFTFQTGNKLTMPVSAPGSAGMESCFTNLVERGDKVLVLINGVFGKRMAENARRLGADLIILEFPWGRAIDVEKVREAVATTKNLKLMSFVHAETSTGAVSDAAALCQIARDAGVLTIVDTVTSWCGIEVDVDGWQADAVYSGTQKCLSAVPGIAPVSFSERATEVIRQRSTPVSSWFLDMGLVMEYWQGGGQRAYHHTAPVNTLYAIHEALRLVVEEGLEQRWKRHRQAHLRLVEGLADLGLEMLVPEGERLPMLNTVIIPEGVDEAAVRKELLQTHNVEIGAGLGPLQGKVWRIGLMGENATIARVEKLLQVLAEVLEKQVTTA